MTDISQEFEKAIAYELTDEDMERAKLLIGVDTASRTREHISVATPDAIRNWAFGMGDDNPLHVDEEYGPTTRWGSQIASPTFVGHIKTPLLGDPVPSEIKAATKGLFRGIHVFVSGGTWDFYRPLFPGDRLYSFSGLESVETKDSEFAGRSVVQVSRNAIFNQRAEVVGVYRILTILTARKESRDRGKYAAIESASYTDEDIERIDAIYAAETVRGAEKRWWEDVSVGDELQPMVKGPLTVTEVIAFHAGGYGFVPYGLRSSRVGYKNRQRIKPFYIKNELGVPDVAQRLHWDSAWAQAIGNPMAYDYGVMRQSWFQHHVTDWMGDDGCLLRLEDSIRKFNYQGDTQFLTGKVVDKRIDDDRRVVDLELKMVNQRDTETAFGRATVALPSRDGGLPVFAPVPTDLARKTVQMYARHNELRYQSSRGAG
jgi:acyl dehydratase